MTGKKENATVQKRTFLLITKAFTADNERRRQLVPSKAAMQRRRRGGRGGAHCNVLEAKAAGY